MSCSCLIVFWGADCCRCCAHIFQVLHGNTDTIAMPYREPLRTCEQENTLVLVVVLQCEVWLTLPCLRFGFFFFFRCLHVKISGSDWSHRFSQTPVTPATSWSKLISTTKGGWTARCLRFAGPLAGLDYRDFILTLPCLEPWSGAFGSEYGFSNDQPSASCRLRKLINDKKK